jgi:hypothetical protein
MPAPAFAAHAARMYGRSEGTFIPQPTLDSAFLTFVSPPATDAPTLMLTPTLTPTSKSTATPPLTSTGTSTPTGTATATATATATSTPVISAQTIPEDYQDKKPKQTEEQRLQEQLTKRSGKDDVRTEDTVAAVDRPAGATYLLVTLAPARDETLVMQVVCSGSGASLTCPDIQVGDYLEADGYQHGVGDLNGYLVAADGITVWRNGHTVK